MAVAGAFSQRIAEETFLWVALGLFAAMVGVSMLYSRMPPYRQLRAHAAPPARPEAMKPDDWYAAELALERKLYGDPRERNHLRLPRRQLDADLQTQLDRERTGVFVTQLLFLLVIAALVLARLA